MQFGIVQREKFEAEDGSYSLVTPRELIDSQITATDAETTLLRNYFLMRGESIHVGNVGASNGASAKQFKLYPNGQKITLNLVYPKPEKGELRLYLSKRAGFFPNEGDVWFLYKSRVDGCLWIGAMPENEWRKENAFGKNDDDAQPQFDDIDAEILSQRTTADTDEIEDREAIEVEVPRQRQIIRSRELAVLRMQKSRYKCEFDNTHQLFIAKATGCRFLEVHHIIPVRFQRELHGLKLDSINNLCCLCPNCHRAIHHAEDSLVKTILNRVATERNISGHFGLSMNDLYRLYSVEDIVRQ